MNLRHFGIACMAVLAGCSLGPEKRDQPAVFDFGPPRAVSTGAPATAATLLIPAVVSSTWLDSSNIYYRMARDAGRADAYAQHQWTQSPAALLTERLRARLAGASRGVVGPLDGAKADYALRVELEDFSQVFSDAQTSKVAVRLRASLIDLNTRALRAQKTFVAERPAPPNAAGAAGALALAADAMIDDMAAWTVETLK